MEKMDEIIFGQPLCIHQYTLLFNIITYRK